MADHDPRGPDVHEADHARTELRRTVLARRQRLARPEVVALAGPPPGGTRHLVPGSLLVLVAPAGSARLARLTAAAGEGDHELLDLLLSDVVLDVLRTTTDGDGGEGRPLAELPSLLDVRYGNRVLVRGMFPLPSLEVAAAAVLWTGGELQADRFAAVEHVADPGAPPLAVTVVEVPPRLSDVERAVLARVPPESAELHVRGTDLAWIGGLARYVRAAQRFVRRVTQDDATIRPFVIGPVRGACPPVLAVTVGASHAGSLSRADIDAALRRADIGAAGDAPLAASVDRLLDLRAEILFGDSAGRPDR